MKKLLLDFCLASGQVLNLEKSKFYVPSKANPSCGRKIQQELNFQKGSLPTKYLGVPLYSGRTKSAHFDFILDNIRKKITGWKAKLLSWGGKITIITSILNSIPIYALSVLPVPKKTVIDIQRSIADFLWNQGDQRRLHWVAWNKVVKPIEEGGLNLKLLSECSFFWRSKLAWSYLQNKTLWSIFMNQKYKQDSASLMDSKLWKELVPLINILKPECFWRIGIGQVPFWTQKWWPMDLAVTQQEDLPDIFVAEVWSDLNKKGSYLAALPEEIQHFAWSLQLNSSPDYLVWKGSETGIFSSKEFRLNHTANSVDRCAWWKKIWQPWIPTKISCFLWRCLNQAVPVDELIQRAKVPLVSKCVCCPEGNLETLHHLFLGGKAAKSLWNFLGGIFDVRGYSPSFNQAAADWIQNSPLSSQYGCLKILAFAVGVWELWKWRNNSIYGIPEDQQNIKRRVIFQIQQMNSLIFPKRKASWLESLAISCLHIHSSQVKPRRGKWTKWIPHQKYLTVNISAVAKGGLLRGSFVARNKEGDVIWCKCRSYTDGQDLFQVLCYISKDAIIFLHNSGHLVSELQSDEGKLIDCLKGRRAPPWRWVSQIQALRDQCNRLELKHIDKKVNLVAALVAGIEQEDHPNPQSLPDIKRVLAEDRSGLARWVWC